MWILAFVGILLAASPLQDADGLVASPEPDWPQWRGPRRDGVSAEKGLLKEWPDGGPKLLWKVDGIGRGWSSPTIVGDRITITGDVGDDLVIRALDLNGKLLWKATNGRFWKDPYPGARASCTFSEGRLYHMNAHGRVACLDASSGKELWALDVLKEFEGQNITWAMSENLLVDGPRLFVTPGGRKALMVALDKTSGKILWTTEPLADDQATYAAPILVRRGGRRTVINSSSAHTFGVDADTGKRLWTVGLKNQYGTNVAPAIYGDGQFHVATAYFAGACYRLSADGTEVAPSWTTPFDTVTGIGMLADGVLYGGGYQKFKTWLAVDWKSGETRGSLRELPSGPAAYADGRLYILAEDGRAALVTPASEGFKIAGQFRLTPKRVDDAWAHPVILKGRLYLRHHDTLWCYDARSP